MVEALLPLCLLLRKFFLPRRHTKKKNSTKKIQRNRFKVEGCPLPLAYCLLPIAFCLFASKKKGKIFFNDFHVQEWLRGGLPKSMFWLGTMFSFTCLLYTSPS